MSHDRVEPDCEKRSAERSGVPWKHRRQYVYSKGHPVKVLSKEIALLQKRGYTLDQIAETLRGEGLDITTPTLKSYLQRIKAGKNKTQKEPDNVQKKDAQKEQQNRMTPEHKKPADTDQSESSSKAAFTPKPDSDDI